MDLFSKLTRAAEVDDFDGTSFRIAEQNVLWLQVAVYDVEFGWREEQQRRADLLSELTCQVEWHTAKIGISQKIIEVVGEHLENEAEMIVMDKVLLQLHYNKRAINI